MPNKLTSDLINYIENVLATAQIGLTFSKDQFDIERFNTLKSLSAELLSRLENEKVVKTSKWIALDENYTTPKIDVRAVIFDEQKRILLVQEKSDGNWTLPGGWCDIGESASESVAREVEEETGLEVKAIRLLALFDKLKHDHPPQLPHAYKCFFLCNVNGGTVITETNETSGCAYFSLENLPPLSRHRVTASQLVKVAKHVYSEQETCLFD
ncbi:NUDIX hydrolase [Glaciimonas soli]|uniref:NUDIX domain-containing protein n=1 Tax=Glaciimonas soli TaxID=2590999 RepID=A0A843YPT1_9BURK|nr:NUDIX hydrolase N-terminal domain-containing protein [Glaciimonas soli]MQR01030.1 NUDIX domain-containing protein [Glaciimonas soli]